MAPHQGHDERRRKRNRNNHKSQETEHRGLLRLRETLDVQRCPLERAYPLVLRSMTSLSQNRCDGDHNLGDLGSGAGAIWWAPTPRGIVGERGPYGLGMALSMTLIQPWPPSLM